MDKDDTNICKKVLIAGHNICDGGELLNECITWCKTLNIRCVTKGTDPFLEREQAVNLKLKQGLWREKDKEIRTALDKLKKVKQIDMNKTKRERNYLRELF